MLRALLGSTSKIGFIRATLRCERRYHGLVGRYYEFLMPLLTLPVRPGYWQGWLVCAVCLAGLSGLAGYVASLAVSTHRERSLKASQLQTSGHRTLPARGL